MILRERVGGGGNEKSSFVMTDMVGCCCAGRLREVWVVVLLGSPGWYDESEPLLEGVAELLLARSASGKAVGGKWNAGASL